VSDIGRLHDLRRKYSIAPADWDEIQTLLFDYDCRDRVKDVFVRWTQSLATLQGRPITVSFWSEVDALLGRLVLVCLHNLEAYPSNGDSIIRGENFRYVKITVPGLHNWQLIVVLYLPPRSTELKIDCTLQRAFQ
jgi:hypothetical protein